MAAAQITVSNSKLWYGTAAEITALSSGEGASVGDVGWASDTNTEYTCSDAATPTWKITRLHNTAGAAQVTLNTLLSGEDQTNDVLKVEAQFNYETVAASQTAQVLGSTGAAGDYLHSVIVTTSTGTVTVLDNATTVAVIPAASTGVWPINAVSESGAWKITTAASTTCTAIGRFT